MILRYAAALAAAMVIAPVSTQAQNYPNNSCYLSDGSQYYMRAFRGGRMIEERGICDESGQSRDIPMTINGYEVYLSQRDFDWLISMAGVEVLLVRVNKQTGQNWNLGRY